MADKLYPKFKENILSGDIDMINDTIKLALVDTAYVYDDAHGYYSSVIAHVVGVPVVLLNKSVINGVFDADDINFINLTGADIGAYVLYQDVGSTIASKLIMYVDDIGSFPFSPAGLDVYVMFNNGAGKIFAL